MSIKKKIEQIIEKEISDMLGTEADDQVSNSLSKKIVILNRGWVAVGDFSRCGDMCRLENASVIRRWGTTEGLGELAIGGPQSDTILDPILPIEFHILTTVAIMDVEEEKWK